MEFQFQKDNPDLLKRKSLCEKIRRQNQDKVPIICEKAPKSTLEKINKTKYLVPGDFTVSKFKFIISERIQLPKEQAFFLLVNGKTSINGDNLLSEMYEKYKDEKDGFLYIAYF